MNIEGELQRAKNRYKDNKRLIDGLKKWKRKDLDVLFSDAHEAVFAEIDCMECGNCCKSLGPRVTNRDVEIIGKHINMRAGKVRKNFLRLDEDNDFVFNEMPCPFLGAGNVCFIYESRPRACREYPHTEYPNMQKKLNLTLRNSLVCPGIFRILEKIRADISGA